jgi:CheY-like chemotaxis protein
MENIMGAGVQRGNMIDEILEMARIERGNISINCEVLDCLDVMTEACRTLQIMAQERGILFTVDTSGNLPSILADRRRLVQILLNIGSNAIKYNFEGGWVLLSAVPCDGAVRFIVRDTGKGVPAERHGEVFEPFNRLGVEMTGVEGTGIGLTISRRLAEAMGGKLEFESTVGQGSKFWVELPAVSEKTAMAVRAPSLSGIAADKRCKILYIEDKIPNIELMRVIIEDLKDTRFLDAQTVEDGIGIACSVRPELVITDIHLPDGNGFDVLRRLRADRRTAHIPVIALTADAMPANLHNMERAGFDHILTKPLMLEDLMTILHAGLKAA